jgi:hypothetical protein
MKSNQTIPVKQTGRMILVFGIVSVIYIISAQVAFAQFPGARYASYAYQKSATFNPTEFRNNESVPVAKYSDITDSNESQAIPEFAMGPYSEQYQASRIITYDAIAKNVVSMVYTLDPVSEKAGNTIDPSTGEVFYLAGWSGITTITATATTDDGRSFSSAHTATVHPLPIASTSGEQTISSQGTAIITGATAENGLIKWTHNGKGIITDANTLHPVYNAASADAGKIIQLTLTVRSYYEECGEKTATATYNVNVKAVDKP